MPLTETHFFRDVTFAVYYVTYTLHVCYICNIKELILIEFFYLIKGKNVG